MAVQKRTAFRLSVSFSLSRSNGRTAVQTKMRASAVRIRLRPNARMLQQRVAQERNPGKLARAHKNAGNFHPVLLQIRALVPVCQPPDLPSALHRHRREDGGHGRSNT
jgi:hypothetical protein